MLHLKKLPIFYGENATAVLVFLQYLSQICSRLILVACEKAPLCGNLKYTFLLLLTVFSLLSVVYWISRNFFIWLSITKIGYLLFLWNIFIHKKLLTLNAVWIIHLVRPTLCLKDVKLLYFVKIPMDVFLLYTEVVNCHLQLKIQFFCHCKIIPISMLVLVITCLRGEIWDKFTEFTFETRKTSKFQNMNAANFPHISPINMWFLVNHMWQALKEHRMIRITQKTTNQCQI